jgi:CheY-like chemotaxis protein
VHGDGDILLMRAAESKLFLARLLGGRRRPAGAAVPRTPPNPRPVAAPAPQSLVASTPPLAAAALAPTVFVAPACAPAVLAPARVLLVAQDRRFRAVAATLLSQRGYTVLVCRRGDDVVDLAVREAVDVVLLDATTSLTAAAREAARLESLYPPVGIVAVSEETQPGLVAFPVLPKWTAFDDVFGAIDRARRHPTQDGVISGAR